jgi:hypothetical protein
MRRSIHMEVLLMQTMQAPETTKVIYGVNELELDLAGKTVRGICSWVRPMSSSSFARVTCVSSQSTTTQPGRWWTGTSPGSPT